MMLLGVFGLPSKQAGLIELRRRVKIILWGSKYYATHPNKGLLNKRSAVLIMLAFIFKFLGKVCFGRGH